MHAAVRHVVRIIQKDHRILQNMCCMPCSDFVMYSLFLQSEHLQAVGPGLRHAIAAEASTAQFASTSSRPSRLQWLAYTAMHIANKSLSQIDKRRLIDKLNNLAQEHQHQCASLIIQDALHHMRMILKKVAAMDWLELNAAHTVKSVTDNA